MAGCVDWVQKTEERRKFHEDLLCLPRMGIKTEERPQNDYATKLGMKLGIGFGGEETSEDLKFA